MKDYYYERLCNATVKLELARFGYESKMKVLATKLQNEDASLHGPIIDRINALRKAIDELTEEVMSCKAKWQEACDKEGGNDNA